MEDLREQLPLLWTVAPLNRIHGTQVSGSSRMSNEVDAIFEHVIKPALGGASHAKLFRKEGITLRDSFLFGFSICSYLHAHDSLPSDCSVGAIRPLVNTINCLPGPHLEAINVEVNGGKWPFLQGIVFCDDCNFKVSAITATRTLRAGEELVIDYGM
jgi:hypothetical protein